MRHRKVTPYHPQANGEVERFFATMLKAIRALNTEAKDWRRHLDKFLLHYRSTPHTMAGETPAKLLMGRDLKVKLPQLQHSEENQNWEAARQKDQMEKYKLKLRTDTKNRAKPTQIMPGDKVFLKQHKHDKLTTRYDPKPWEVKERRGDSAIFLRGEKRILRSTSQMKMIPEETISRWIEEDEDGYDPYDGHLSHSQRTRLGEHENRQRGTSGEGEIQQCERDEGNEEETLATRRPRRTTRRPLRYQDRADDSDNDEEGATGDAGHETIRQN
ncbi:hypothetical protein GWK47_039731 [Chionoecetes opilio]|uniref:Integrase catalytic domain-containing protein n=1 Tax=Chionoecetes opilio TaxID=41210 RepID=A0A8J4YQR2_CHIOP|nr:hypothetical protein GWK47_039731 [Chionoecetes opilio]